MAWGKGRRVGGVLALAAALCFALLGWASPRTAIDDRGVEIRLDEEPVRIVVVGSSYAQLLVDLGAMHRIVAAASSPDNPDEVAELPSVGPAFGPSIERILALDPDLVVGATDWNGDRQRLEAAGIPVFSLPWFHGLDDILRAVHAMGDLIGAAEAADRLATSLAARVQVLEAGVARGPALRIAFVYAPVPDALYAMGTGTPEDDLILRAGGINVFGDVEGTVQISSEALFHRTIDVLVTDPHHIDALGQNALLSSLPAVAHDRLISIPAHWTGSTRIVDALARLVEALYDIEHASAPLEGDG